MNPENSFTPEVPLYNPEAGEKQEPKNVQLFLAPVMQSAEVGISGGSPPLGIISIATYLRENGVEAEVLDGDILGLEQALDKLKENGLVGIYATNGSYANALAIAERAKEKGNLVVLGGPYGKQLPGQILNKQHSIDIVGMGDGTEAMLLLAKGVSRENIPSICYLNGEEVKQTAIVEKPLEGMPSPDMSLVDTEEYIERAKDIFQSSKRHLSTYSNFGCSWREKKGCLYCATPYIGQRWRKPQEVWEDIESMNELKPDEVWVTSDDFLSDINWIKEFAETIPDDSPDLSCFSRVNWINPEMVDLLKKIKMKCIFFGMESGSDKILRNYTKGATVAMGIRAASLLAEADIEIFPSFVLGAPGEDKESLRATVEMARELYSLGNVRAMETDIMRPSPGSPSWDMLLAKMDPEYREMDFIPMDVLRDEWIRNFCNVSKEDIQNAMDEINSLGNDYRKVTDSF